MGPSPLLMVVFTLTTLCCCSDAYIPRMFLGRPRGGFVGSPRLDHLSTEEQRYILSQVPPAQWFNQRLDHFNPADTRRWQQRYFTTGSVTHAKYLFVMVGGEGTVDPIWNTMGSWIEYAKKFNAAAVQLEHRYYGKSHPTEDMSVANLRFLSSEQALADLATFITAKKEEFSAEKVIVFGGSYPGALSAWMRLKYPYLIDGAVSSSAPLLAQVNFKGYLEVVANSLDTSKPPGACNKAIEAAIERVIYSELPSAPGRQLLKKIFNLCDDIDINNLKDISNLLSSLAGNFEGVVQYNKDNRAFEGAKGTNITIDTICGIMTNTDLGPEMNRYAQVNSLLLRTYSQKCLDFKYANMIDSLKNVSWDSAAAEGGRQWTYQTCTEFGYYQSSDSKKQPFLGGFPIGFWTEQCVDIFGSDFNASFIAQSVADTNINYGALKYPQDRVVFVNGAIDPWHYLGITQSLPQAPAIFIPETAHCANMYPATATDPPTLVKARETIEGLIEKWLKTE